MPNASVISPTGAAVDVVVTFPPDQQAGCLVDHYEVPFSLNFCPTFFVNVPAAGPLAAAISQVSPSLPSLNNGDQVTFPGGIVTVDTLGRRSQPVPVFPSSVTIQNQSPTFPAPLGVGQPMAEQVNGAGLPPAPPAPPMPQPNPNVEPLP